MSVTIPIHRRSFLFGAGAAGAAFGTGLGAAYTQNANPADYTVRIAPLRLELAPGKVIETFGYNGTVPGPLLRLRESRQVSIDITNDTDIADIIHWHGLYVPSTSMVQWKKARRWWSLAILSVTGSRRNQLEHGGITVTTLPARI
jgi:FtsP/CotA-like multicopper oxidase with cupredoxin domain